MTRYNFSLSVVIGVYNDQEVLPLLKERLVPVLNQLSPDWEVLFVEDGSSDASYRLLCEMARREPRFRVVKLARNFGQANALAAGMSLATGAVVVLMDSDLQDRPEDIHLLVDALLNEDMDLAISRWVSREDSRSKLGLSRLFQWTINRFSSVKIVPGMGVFRAIRHEAIEELLRIPERTGTSLGLLHWIGLPHVMVDLRRDARAAGTSGYTLKKMMQLGLERLFSYSFFPITFSINLGLFLFGLSLASGLLLVAQRLFLRELLPGWTSIIVLLLFLFGMNFLILGLYGQYLGRIYIETRGRPKFIIDHRRSLLDSKSKPATGWPEANRQEVHDG